MKKLRQLVNLMLRLFKYFMPKGMQKWINKRVANDKQEHFIVCMLLCAALAFLITPLVSACVIFMVGIAWEIYQKISGKGVFDWYDILADFVGCMFGVGIFYIINFILHY